MYELVHIRFVQLTPEQPTPTVSTAAIALIRLSASIRQRTATSECDRLVAVHLIAVLRTDPRLTGRAANIGLVSICLRNRSIAPVSHVATGGKLTAVRPVCLIAVRLISRAAAAWPVGVCLVRALGAARAIRLVAVRLVGCAAAVWPGGVRLVAVVLIGCAAAAWPGGIRRVAISVSSDTRTRRLIIVRRIRAWPLVDDQIGRASCRERV